MTEPDPEQWVLLECDWDYTSECLVRSDSVRYKDLSTLGWVLMYGPEDVWACPECYQAWSDDEEED